MYLSLRNIYHKRASLNEKGVTLEVVVITAFLALIATGAGVLIYNATRSQADEVGVRANTPQSLIPLFTKSNDGILGIQSYPETTTEAKTEASKMCTHGGYSNPPATICVTCPKFPGQTRISGVDNCSIGSGFTAIASSGRHICGITNLALNPDGSYDAGRSVPSGTVYCWGYNYNDQLGADDGEPAGSYKNGILFESKNLQMPRINGVLELALGTTHTCARTASGVQCWGSNSTFVLGIANSLGACNPPAPHPRCLTRGESSIPQPPIQGITSPTKISAGNGFTCAVEAQQVKCWGGPGFYGILGDFSIRQSHLPQTIKTEDGLPLTGVTDISAGESHVCAIRNSPEENSPGEVWCWGEKTNPDGSFGRSDFAERIQGLPDLDVKKIASGKRFTCIIADDTANKVNGEVWCWGRNHYAQVGLPPRGTFGTPTGNYIYEPQQVLLHRGFTNEKSIVGARDIKLSDNKACIISLTKELICWGININFWKNAQMSTIVYTYRSNPQAAFVPSIIPGPVDIQQMINLRGLICTLDSGNVLKCFGSKSGRSTTFGHYTDDAIQTFLGH